MMDRISPTGVSSTYKPQQEYNNSEKPIKENNLEIVKEKLPTKEKVEEVVSSMNKFLQPTHTSLKFEFHEKLNEYYVTLIDDRTQEIVREIPSKKILDMYAAMTEFIGLMVDKKI
ncbi:flagellar protein FlaG [Peribacillus alkalitolerans]|uniref:flagellar protein FlaG n=1 Tax=Peribacillus alkalitolerans TaxID=1550385 RepID=UPI0013D8DEC9|nr:flagellar protein FlaG [Peribacillus alkalitolerans]